VKNAWRTRKLVEAMLDDTDPFADQEADA